MKLNLLLLSSLPLSLFLGCTGSHIGLDLESVKAVRGEDNRVTVSVGVQCTVTGDPAEAANIEEVCVEVTWAQDASDGGVRPYDGGSGISQTLPTGPALFSAKKCTKERFTHGEVKTISVQSTEPIPDTGLLATVSITGSAPKSRIGLLVRDTTGNQIVSP